MQVYVGVQSNLYIVHDFYMGSKAGLHTFHLDLNLEVTIYTQYCIPPLLRFVIYYYILEECNALLACCAVCMCVCVDGYKVMRVNR